MTESQLIELDGSSWKSKDDVWVALLNALRAPDWHGRNLDALDESLRDGNINKVNPPVMITFFGSQEMGPEALDTARRIVHFCDQLAESGVAVDAAMAAGRPE